MEDLSTKSVFISNITRNKNQCNNDLYELICITAATPIEPQKTNSGQIYSFRPNMDKYYVPKKRPRLKVNTVRDIRNVFEKEVYAHLPVELEKQEDMWLQIIKNGSSKTESSKTLANGILNSDNPVSKAILEMLVNLNPNSYKHKRQFVLWNGKYIRINGSRGGENKFICNFDLGNGNGQKSKIIYKKKITNKKISLIKKSLFVNFKPGPLGKKKYLDNSHQKYNVGNVELIDLPKLGLEIQPSYGVPLDLNLIQFLNRLNNQSGIISQQWAEFSISVLGTMHKSKAVQKDPHSTITFNLNYRSDQNRVLMRRDLDIFCGNNNSAGKTDVQNLLQDEDSIIAEVKKILNSILDSVEIGFIQDNLFTEFDGPYREVNSLQDSSDLSLNNKEKQKRKYTELDRLDVTVIQLPEKCSNSFCKLGCVCESLKCPRDYKTHCGLLGCMFGCKCGFYKTKSKHLNKEWPKLPSLVSVNNEKLLKLAREEQKFHQTVIVSGEKQILLKGEKRNNYENFNKFGMYTDSTSELNKILKEKQLSVNITKLMVKNVEPWCMVHNLYKCFCKNRFNEKYNIENDVKKVIAESSNNDIIEKQCNEILNSSKITTRHEKRESLEKLRNYISSNNEEDNTCTSARVNMFKGRKYADNYYKTMNRKILDMEKNDFNLKEKLMNINNLEITQNETEQPTEDETLYTDNDISETNSETQIDQAFTSDLKLGMETMPYSELVKWVEDSYKYYKYQLEKGNFEKGLEAPKYGKMVLHTWEFILNRYKQKKNIFIVTKDEPFRIFMVINIRNPVFKNCINIDNIRLANLNDYPVTVRKLLTDSTELKDNFCILRGLSHCWELVGSLAKNNRKVADDSGDNSEYFNFSESPRPDLCDPSIDSSTFLNNDSNSSDSFTEKLKNKAQESSRWFVMRIENDFSEIQFHKKGFFVKYENILKAINVARQSGKTVRISSQKCVDPGNGPQFGIYAIPNVNDYFVFVGPYETDESLSITTVKTFLDIKKQNKTRGVWITTNKIDNLNVINNPLLFMPSSDKTYEEMIPLSSHSDVSRNDIVINNYIDNEEKTQEETIHTSKTSTSEIITKTVIKTVKPIKIRKVDSAYRITSSNFVKNLFVNKSAPVISSQNTNKVINLPDNLQSEKPFNSISKANTKPIKALTSVKLRAGKPVAQVTPQLNAGLQQILKNTEEKHAKLEKGIIILKPEEITNEIFQNSNINKTSSFGNNVRKFLSEQSSVEDVLIISDEDESREDMSININTSCEELKNIKIRCNNINSVAWLPGRINNKKLLSFTFPGYSSSIFYEEGEAFSEINRLLSEKIYIPEDLQLQWQVIENDNDLKDEQNILTSEVLNGEYILTSAGLQHKSVITTQAQDIEHDDGTLVIPLNNILTEIRKTLPDDVSIEEAIVLDDGSLFVMDDTNKNKISEALTGSSDSEKLKFLNVLDSLQAENAC